jgi:hypothetical protein
LTHVAPRPALNTLERSDDEIDLLGLLKAVLATWKLWFIALIVVTGLYGAYQASKIVILSNEVTYAKPIRLTFPDAHKLQFPNGSPFAFGDIIAPAVVQAAHQRNQLNEYDMSVADLQGSLSAEPYAPTYPAIVEKYHKLLADKKLTFDQTEEIQGRMQAELDQASRGTVLISMRLDKSQLPESVASKVLSDIPAIWAERAIKDKGVLNLNINLSSSRSLNIDLIQTVEYMIVSDLLDEKVALLRGNIEKLAAFEGVSTISDPESGMKLTDLTNAIDDMNRYVIDELMSPIRYLGLSRDAQLSIFYYEDRLKKLRMELSLLQNQASLAKEAFDTYRRAEQVMATGGESSSMVVSQLGGDTLDKLMQMSGEAEREAYKQRLNQQWLDFNLQAAQVKSRITDVELIVISLREAAKSHNGGERLEAHQLYLDRVNDALPGILKQLSSYFDVTERIYNQLSIEAVGVRDRLYSPITNRVLTEKEGLDVKKVILVWLALMFLTTVIVIPVLMIRNAMKKSPS